MTTIEFELSEASIDNAIEQVESYKKKVKENTKQLVEEAATTLEEYAAFELSKHVWTGETLASLRKEFSRNSMTARVLVGGAAVWLEFGTGVVANGVSAGTYVHPKASELGMQPIGQYGWHHGSYSTGWYYYDEEGRRRHTYGIPTTMFMYHSAQNVARDLPEIGRRLFRT